MEMQSAKYELGPVESTRGKTSSAFYYSNIYFDFHKGTREKTSQRAYSRSCDGNTATSLADRREVGRFMVSLCPTERSDL